MLTSELIISDDLLHYLLVSANCAFFKSLQETDRRRLQRSYKNLLVGVIRYTNVKEKLYGKSDVVYFVANPGGPDITNNKFVRS